MNPSYPCNGTERRKSNGRPQTWRSLSERAIKKPSEIINKDYTGSEGVRVEAPSLIIILSNLPSSELQTQNFRVLIPKFTGEPHELISS